MCGLHAYEKRKYKSTGATDFHCGLTLPEDSSVNPPFYLCVTIHFIDMWINILDKNITWRSLACQYNMKEMFQNNFTEVKIIS